MHLLEFFHDFQVHVLETPFVLTYFMILCQISQFRVPIWAPFWTTFAMILTINFKHNKTHKIGFKMESYEGHLRHISGQGGTAECPGNP